MLQLDFQAGLRQYKGQGLLVYAFQESAPQVIVDSEKRIDDGGGNVSVLEPNRRL